MNECLKAKVAEIEENVKKYNNMLEDRIVQYKVSLEEAKNSLELSDEKRNELVRINGKLTEENERLGIALREKDRICRDSEVSKSVDNKNLLQTIEDLKTKLSEAEGQLNTNKKEYEDKVSELRKSLDEKKKICDYSGKESSNLQKENLNLKVKVEKNLVEIQKIGELQKGLITENDELKKNIKELQDK